MIPKIIHYCWFGNKPLPEEVKKYILTWKSKCPDYEIKEWNESNFDINSSVYVQEAYKNKKWAFVADYVRLYVLVNYGGIYLDTDVELIKSFDDLIYFKAFCGFEDENKLSTAVLGSEPHFPIFNEWFHMYDNRKFIDANGELDLEPNVFLFTKICNNYGLQLTDQEQNIKGLKVYPRDWFSPKDYYSNKLKITQNTVAIHHFKASWQTPTIRQMHDQEVFFINKFGSRYGKKIAQIFNLFIRFKIGVNKRGFIKELKYFFKIFKC